MTIQEILALTLVAVVAGIALWRRRKSRRVTGCDKCPSNAEARQRDLR